MRPSDPLDLERDLPTSAADVAALHKLKEWPVRTQDYLRFLASFPKPTQAELRARPGPSGSPFEL